MKIFHDWSYEELEKICLQDWKIDGDDDWYKEDLCFTDLILEDWTCEAFIESVNQDIEQKLSAEEILEKYVKSSE